VGNELQRSYSIGLARPGIQVCPPRDWTLLLWFASVTLFSCRPIRSLARIRMLRRRGIEAEAWIAEMGLNIAKRMECTRAGFFDDQRMQEEKNVQAITGNSPEDQRKLLMALDKLAHIRAGQSVAWLAEAVVQRPSTRNRRRECSPYEASDAGANR
jgi:hypothetical protein